MKFTDKRFKNLLMYFLVFAMILSNLVTPITALASTLDLVITGEGVENDVIIRADDWSKYQLREAHYSTNNSLGFHKIVKTKGYDLFDLIGASNLKRDKDYSVKFTCADGFEFSKTISELENTYYYPDFQDKNKVKSIPMLAKYTAVIADYPKNNFNPPITFTDRSLTEEDLDKDSPKLVFGQNGIDDMNMSQWGKEIIKITVGEARKSEGISMGSKSTYKHIAYDGAPYNIDAITSATLTIEGPAVEGYRAISLRQIEEDTKGQSIDSYFEKRNKEVVVNSYEGINVKYLIDNYVNVKANAGNVVFKDKSRKTIFVSPISDVEKYTVAYGVNDLPLVFLDSDVGYKADKGNDNGCFKLVYKQDKDKVVEFSNIAYIYIEEKDAKNIYEHNYAPYNNPKYTDYEMIIHGDALGKEVKYSVKDIEAMKDLQFEEEYSLSNSEYFWYYNTYKGVKLWDLLLKSGLDPKIDENTKIRFIAADNYNFAPMTIKEIKDNSRYGYYEKHVEDKGDGSFDGKNVEPLYKDMPILVAYGFNKYPYVMRPTDDGYNPGLGNDGGPLRVIFGKTSYSDPNGGNQVQFLKEIIIGEGESIATETGGSGKGEDTSISVDKNSAWTHDQGLYKEYLDMPVLRITGSQVKEPITFTLRQLESMSQYAKRDVYSGDGVHEFEGLVLWDLISEVVELKDGVENPSIRIFSGQNYNQILRSNEQVVNGVLNSQGKLKNIILAYAVDGYPLVPNEGSTGYANNNAYGPIRLIIEENKSMWVKWIDCIVVGTGDYEAPDLKDIIELDLPESPEAGQDEINIFQDKILMTYLNDTGKELPEASVRAMEYDKDNNLWIATNNGGLAMRSSDGKWTLINEIETENAGLLKVDTSYAIVQRENGDLWMTLGGALSPQGIIVKSNDGWKLLNVDNSQLPSNFVQELELDGNGGLWIGTGGGLVYVDKDENWKAYTKEDGLVLDSIDAIKPDNKGGVWFGYYPETSGEGEDVEYIGAYQYMDKDGNITTYDGFDSKNFNVNWVRSISMDDEGGIWVVRSGNAPGFGYGEIDYIKDGKVQVYTAKDLIPNIDEDEDVRFLVADNGILYIGTKAGGVLASDKPGSIIGRLDSANGLENNKWNNVYYLDMDNDNLFIGTNGGAAVLNNTRTFTDIESHWAKKEIEAMSAKNYIKGYGNVFKPNENITRAEFISIISRILGLATDNTAQVNFKDVNSKDWFYNDVAMVAAKGLIKGYEDNSFRPSSPIKRQEVSSIISNLLENNLTQDRIDEILLEFKDQIPTWAKNSVARAVDLGLINGLPDKTFGGDQYATRAQAVVILYRYLEVSK